MITAPMCVRACMCVCMVYQREMVAGVCTACCMYCKCFSSHMSECKSTAWCCILSACVSVCVSELYVTFEQTWPGASLPACRRALSLPACIDDTAHPHVWLPCLSPLRTHIHTDRSVSRVAFCCYGAVVPEVDFSSLCAAGMPRDVVRLSRLPSHTEGQRDRERSRELAAALTISWLVVRVDTYTHTHLCRHISPTGFLKWARGTQKSAQRQGEGKGQKCAR
mmetsp:Transcript_35400/g.87985  ORF Transcript_35400/g.87985 Transcript_35400/m.87985 type:complete len:222 (-) Transcript_35400:50-715(-)